MPVVFFVATFALTWTTWIAAAAVAGPANDGVFGVRGPVFLIGVFGPSIVALALTARSQGRDGIVALLSRAARWNVAPGWYVFAVAYYPAVRLAAAVVHRAALGSWPPFGDTPWVVLLAIVLISWWGQAGEEIGWRGYALPRVAARAGLGGASLLLGVIWACWHLPLFLLPGTGSTGRPFPVYLLHVTSLSVAIAWLYWKTGASLLLVMVMHAAVNNTTGIVGSPMPEGSVLSFDAPPILWITVAVSWAVALALLYDMRGATLPEPV